MLDVYPAFALVAKNTLQLYENCLRNDYEWEEDVRAEAIRLFKIADSDADGFLDVDELTSLTAFKEMAERLIDKIEPLKGKVSLEEWCKHFQGKGDAGLGSLPSAILLHDLISLTLTSPPPAPVTAFHTMQLYENCLQNRYEWAER